MVDFTLSAELQNMVELTAPTPTNAPLFDEAEILAGIETWVRLESPTFAPERVNAMMDLASAELARVGAVIRRVPGTDGYGDVVIAEIAGQCAGPGNLVLGHLDTVHPEGSLAAVLPWRRDGDKVFGPGCYDMKGGLYLAYYALRQILAAGKRPYLPVTFMLISDEEVGSPSTRQLIEETACQHAHVLVPEPAKDGNLVTGRHAFQRFTLTAHGRPAHAGATLARGRSAIREIAEQIIRLEEMGDPDRGITLSVGVVNGGRWVNVVPLTCRAEVLVVTPSADAFDEIRARILALTPIGRDIELCVDAGPVRPLFAPTAAGLALYDQARDIAGEIGFNPGHGSYGGGSDGNFTGALGVPTLDGLGVCGDGAHTHEEHLLVSSLVPRARLLAGLFERLGRSPTAISEL